MTIIFLKFAANPASVENVIIVTDTLQNMNPKLMETARTQDSITLSSPDERVDIYGNIFEKWASMDPPIIATYNMSGDPYPLLSGL
ncbi:uncharacterized protein N7529_004838 [Penicillium soppii]|jgi:hypothetical protein|uniref:uncharacterized protein n=1 Tax=Penicillium soppii TaxID=69789 RepID=UPI0025498377|nr:uncharacterized protein N7529_004838 [Penicillium soppii]KAJ5872485.1 hypothetical protein N7529_004838 [Penicillium soppii]